jgi:putative transposase
MCGWKTRAPACWWWSGLWRTDGTKELLTLADGFRESKDSWLELLRDLKAHGLREGPKLAIADGSLGFWLALQEAYEPGVDQQRCSRP